MKQDITQQMMNEVYDYWSCVANGGRKNDILTHFSEAHKMAVRFGNFNYQIENGGISQWIFNGYMEDDIEELLAFCEQGREWGIFGIEKFHHLFSTVDQLMKNWEERSTHECSTCDGTGEITYTDLEDIAFVDEEIEEKLEEEGEITLSCDECSGSGEYEEDNEYPDGFGELEDDYYHWEERLDVIGEMVKKQLEEQEKERTATVFSLRRGTKTKVSIQQNQHTKTLHVLDLDEEGTTSLTNAIDEIEAQIQEQYDFDKLYLYHTDGMITTYENHQFAPVKESDILIYRPFFMEMNTRKIV